RSTQDAPRNEVFRIAAPGPAMTNPAITEMTARRELASTSATSAFTTDGTSALLVMVYAFDSTSRPNASGYSQIGLSRWRAIEKQMNVRPSALMITSVRRPARLRSSIGPRTGATTANGAIVSTRYSAILPRAAPGLIEKNSDPASAIVTRVS